MVQSAQNGRDTDMAARLDGAWEWRVFRDLRRFGEMEAASRRRLALRNRGYPAMEGLKAYERKARL